MSPLPQSWAVARLGAKSVRFAIPVLLFALAVTGCAAHGSHFASKFVHPGTPSVSFDDPVGPPKQLGQYIRDVRAQQAKAGPKSSLLPTLETRDSALAKALLL